MSPILDPETGLVCEGDEWLADWKPSMTPDEWESSRQKAREILAPKQETLARLLTLKAKKFETNI